MTGVQQTVLPCRAGLTNAALMRMLRAGLAVALFVISALSAASDELPSKKLPRAGAEGDAARADGEALYMEHCATCHKQDGSGYVTVIPPLAGSDYIAADVQRLVSVTVDGLSGPVTVNGLRYEGVMPAMSHLSDLEIARILNYVLRKWGDPTNEFSPEEIGDYRKASHRRQEQPTAK